MSAIRAVVRAFLVVAGVLFLGWLVSTLAVIGFAARDNVRAADAIVVLGAAQYAGRPSPVLKARLDHAVALWHRKVAPRLIVTGGIGPGDTTSEALVARTYVGKHGVPAARVLLEARGRTTNESMRAVAGILQANDLNSAVLVSDPFHMFRLWLLAHRYGFRAHTSPTRTSPIDPNAEQRWRYILNESVKAPAAFFFDRAR